MATINLSPAILDSFRYALGNDASRALAGALKDIDFTPLLAEFTAETIIVNYDGATSATGNAGLVIYGDGNTEVGYFKVHETDTSLLVAKAPTGSRMTLNQSLATTDTVQFAAIGIGAGSPSRPLSITAVDNELIALDCTTDGGDCTIRYRTSFGTDVNWAVGAKGSDDSFRISNSASVGTTDRMTIDSNGNVGIGTDAPSRPLSIQATDNELIRIDSTTNGADCSINYRTSFGTDVNWTAGIKGSDDGFYISNGSALGTNDRLAIDSSGNVSVSTGTLTVGSKNVTGLESFVLACSDETTALTTGTAKVTFRMPYAFTVTSVRGSLTTAGTGVNLVTVDINEGGSTILGNKITFTTTEKTSTTAVAQPTITDASLADDAEMTVDIDQIDSGGVSAGLKVYITGYQTA